MRRSADKNLRRPYILSRVNWNDPRHDPIVRQFLPMKSLMMADHPKLALDSLHETADSPVKGLVHRYTDKALFLRMFAHILIFSPFMVPALIGQ